MTFASLIVLAAVGAEPLPSYVCTASAAGGLEFTDERGWRGKGYVDDEQLVLRPGKVMAYEVIPHGTDKIWMVCPYFDDKMNAYLCGTYSMLGKDKVFHSRLLFSPAKLQYIAGYFPPVWNFEKPGDEPPPHVQVGKCTRL